MLGLVVWVKAPQPGQVLGKVSKRDGRGKVLGGVPDVLSCKERI